MRLSSGLASPIYRWERAQNENAVWSAGLKLPGGFENHSRLVDRRRRPIATDECAEVVPELRATPSITRRHEVACIKVETLSGAL